MSHRSRCSVFISPLNVGPILEENPDWSVSTSSSRGPMHSSSSRLSHGPRGLAHSQRRNTHSCFTCSSQMGPSHSLLLLSGLRHPVATLALSCTGFAGFVFGAGVLSAPVCVLEFLGMLCHLCFWTCYPLFWVHLFQFFGRVFFFFLVRIWENPNTMMLPPSQFCKIQNSS